MKTTKLRPTFLVLTILEGSETERTRVVMIEIPTVCLSTTERETLSVTELYISDRGEEGLSYK